MLAPMRPRPTSPSSILRVTLCHACTSLTARVARRKGDTAADVLVIFGITGDLARKMTFRALYRLEARKKLSCPIVGVARNDWTDADLVQHAREAVSSSDEDPD